MTTVTRRTLRSSPQRDALSTWNLIVDLLTAYNKEAKFELKSVGGIASSIIADKACDTSCIIVSCEGPQTRFYCLYDDDAIDGSDANEEILGFNPLKGNWAISLPCPPEDLSWVQSALKEKSNRITARDQSEKKPVSDDKAKTSSELEIDIEGFLGS